MNSIENEDKLVTSSISIETESEAKIVKKKKKKIKKVKKAKKCSGLKELLDQIAEEKLAKSKKEKEKEKKEKEKEKVKEKKLNIEINKKDESLINSCISSPIENEGKNKEYSLKDHINIINNSVSGTTVATSYIEDFNDCQRFNYDKYSDGYIKCEYNDLRPNYLLKNFETSEDDKIDDDLYFHNKRKKSSPICDYYNGFDKILSEIHKGSVDLANSFNFIKKEDLISSNICLKNSHNNKYTNNYKNTDTNINILNSNNNNDYNNNSIINENNIDNDNIINNSESKINSDNNYINSNDLNQIDINNTDDCYYMNYPYYPYVDYYNYIPESFINPNYNINKMENNIFFNKNKHRHNYKINKNEKNELNNSKNNNNNNTSNNKKENILYVRDGDWFCQFCLNLNFSFRSFCNRCKAHK